MKQIKYTRQARGIGTTTGRQGITTARHMDSEERLKRVYSKASWRKLRAHVKAQGFTTCVRCNKPSEMLDHIRPVQLSPRTAFDPRNVQPMCRPCHAWKTENIDAPNRNPAMYRHDRAHLADMRPAALRRWADEFVSSGVAAQQLGSFALDAAKPRDDDDGWMPIC